jgi:hypothetical protein
LIFQEKKKFVCECISKEYSAAVVIVVVLDYIVSKRKVRKRDRDNTKENV